MTPALSESVKYLGELGTRWGLPEHACRVHGFLFLVARPVSRSELANTMEIGDLALDEALQWLTEYGLVQCSGTDWRTGSDPWDLMLRALEERRRREIGPALEKLSTCQSNARRDTTTEPAVAGQIGKMLALAEDLAAIDAQARRMSPHTLRQIVGVGARAAKLMDRAFGRRKVS